MKQYIVDAFTDEIFKGNQAAVCVLDRWIPDELMQNIAKENNFSETAFTVKEGQGYRLRWFTPGGEIDFCGHATLGTAFVLLNYYDSKSDQIHFYTQSGELTVVKREDLYEMDCPAYDYEEIPVTDQMEDAFGARPCKALLSRDMMAVFDCEDTVRNLNPDQEKMKALKGLCVGVTAHGKEYDCVSRVFGPKLNVAEDPVTGSTHCLIAPYWKNTLGKDDIKAYQASARTGVLICRCIGDRVKVSGKAVVYSVCEILSEKFI